MKAACTELRHADRWITQDMLAAEPDLRRHDPTRDLDLWRRLYSPTDLVRVGRATTRAALVRAAEYCWGCTWRADGVPTNTIAICMGATDLVRSAPYSRSMTRREVCEAVIGRMRANDEPILQVVDDGADGLEVWTDAVASEYRMVNSRGRCPGGRNARTGRGHRVLWAYPGLFESWAAEEWHVSETAPDWLDAHVDRAIGWTATLGERKAR